MTSVISASTRSLHWRHRHSLSSAMALQQQSLTIPYPHKRFRSTVFFSDEKGTAEENVYFKKEDENLLKNLLSAHPELNPKYATPGVTQSESALLEDVNSVCTKHGFEKRTSNAFVNDVRVVFEKHGWKRVSPPAGFNISRPKIAGRNSAKPD